MCLAGFCEIYRVVIIAQRLDVWTVCVSSFGSFAGALLWLSVSAWECICWSSGLRVISFGVGHLRNFTIRVIFIRVLLNLNWSLFRNRGWKLGQFNS